MTSALTGDLPWAGYVRVSTGKQADSGLGLAAQRAKLGAWAEFHGRTVIVVEDAGESGSTLDRPGWRQVEADLSEGRLGGVVVVKLDRITRSVRDLLALVDRHFTGDAAPGFVSCSEAIDTTTPMGRFVLTIFGALGQLERELIGERTRDAMQAAKLQGRIVGKVPVGRRDRGDGYHEDDMDMVSLWASLSHWTTTQRHGRWEVLAKVANRDGASRADGSPWTGKSIKRLFETANKYGWER